MSNLRTKVHPNGSRAKHAAKENHASATERAARVRKLQTLTQADYQQLFYIIKAIVPPQLCDPYDALSHGLLIALQKYEGNGPLTAFVPRCAYLYGLQQAKKLRRQINFCELQNEEDFEDYLDRILPYLEDPRYVEAVDELFVRRIEEILASLYDWHFRFSTRQALGDATKLLSLFRDNANQGKGIGIDEYEETPPAARDRKRRPTHNTKIVRHLIVEHLCEELQTDRRNIFSALKALRISTRQALHEGLLPC